GAFVALVSRAATECGPCEAAGLRPHSVAARDTFVRARSLQLDLDELVALRQFVVEGDAGRRSGASPRTPPGCRPARRAAPCGASRPGSPGRTDRPAGGTRGPRPGARRPHTVFR